MKMTAAMRTKTTERTVLRTMTTVLFGGCAGDSSAMFPTSFGDPFGGTSDGFKLITVTVAPREVDVGVVSGTIRGVNVDIGGGDVPS
jgi:hypothetical protein